VRFNQDGVLRVPHGYVGALQVDPIEKKPFFHVQPGTDALSFGMLGCDYRCGFCQNWLTSQTMRDDAAGVMPEIVSAEGLVALAHQHRTQSIASTYNEPLITSEWAVDVFRQARQAGLKTLYISNGNATLEVLQYLAPWIDAYKIDLKTMNDTNYRRHIGGVLQNVLDTISNAHDLGLWVEVVTLIIPGLNDSNEELWDAARYIHSVSPDIPWHVTAFHPDYKMRDVPRTTVDTLLRAAEIGAEAGLHYVYAGNLPGLTQNWEDTRCPACQKTVIRRNGFRVIENRLGRDGACPNCHTQIPGRWV
jgi:pyruvate formate lyase activating enzyme